MSTRYAEAVLDSLMMMARDLGEHVEGMTLPPRIYLNVAADFIAMRMFVQPEWTTAAPKRVAYDFLRAIPFGPPDPGVTLDNMYREVCVGSSFVIRGPCGMVTIREGA